MLLSDRMVHFGSTLDRVVPAMKKHVTMCNSVAHSGFFFFYLLFFDNNGGILVFPWDFFQY